MLVLIDCQPLKPGISARTASLLRSMCGVLRNHFAAQRQRRAFARLDARLLADIGLARKPKSQDGAEWRWAEWL